MGVLVLGGHLSVHVSRHATLLMPVLVLADVLRRRRHRSGRSVLMSGLAEARPDARECDQAELTRLEAELSRYAEAIADAGPLETILHAAKTPEQRRDAIRADLKTLGAPRPVETRDTLEIRAELVSYLKNWGDVARQGIAEARRLLRAVLVGRFIFTPVPRPPNLPPRKGPGRKPKLIYEMKGERHSPDLSRG